MTGDKATRGRSTSVSSSASADSFQILSEGEDDWDQLSASVSDTGAAVLSDDEESYAAAKRMGRAESARPGGAISLVSKGLPASPLLNTSEVLAVSHEDSSDATFLKGSRSAAAIHTGEQISELQPSEPKSSGTIGVDDGPAMLTHMSVPASTSPVQDEASSQSMTLLPNSPVSERIVDSTVATPLTTNRPHPHPSIPPREKRIWMHTNRTLPQSLIATAPFKDGDGSPVLVGSALIDGEVRPCKITLSRLGDAGFTPVRLAYRGKEIVHNGVYEVLKVDEDTMEWVDARNGRLPRGRAPVEGGYDREGRRLYYAVTTINGFRVPGETAEHDVRLRSPVLPFERPLICVYRTRVLRMAVKCMSKETTTRYCASLPTITLWEMLTLL